VRALFIDPMPRLRRCRSPDQNTSALDATLPPLLPPAISTCASGNGAAAANQRPALIDPIPALVDNDDGEDARAEELNSSTHAATTPATTPPSTLRRSHRPQKDQPPIA
jgi:hypothetical protein